MKTTDQARSFSSLASSTAPAGDGVRAARELLEEGICQRVPAWRFALESLAKIDHDKAHRAVVQAVDQSNLSEYIKLLVAHDKTTREVVEKVLIQLASKRGAAMGKEIKESLKRQYKLNDRQIEAIIRDGVSVKDYLCPFVMRPAESTTGLHLEEFVSEPDDRPTAAHVSVWIYRQGGAISHLVISGHANHAVCKEVSAKIAATNVRLGEQPPETFTLTGATFLIRTDKQRQKPSKSGITEPPLEDLVKQLRDVESMSGMVKIYEVENTGYEQVCSSLEKMIKEGIKAGTPVLLHHENQLENGRAVFLPFYNLNDSALSPVTLEINVDEFGTDFDDLLEMHGNEYIHEIIADARRRREIYADWLAKDQYRLSMLVQEMFQRFRDHVHFSNPEELANSYLALLESGADMNLPWSPDQPVTQRHILMNLRAQRLVKFIQDKGSSFDVESLLQPYQLAQYGTSKLTESFLPGDLNAAIQSIQRPEYPVSGMRNFAEATIQEGDVVFHISLQEQVEWNLPGLIASDRRWLDHMDEILDQLDPSDPQHRAQMEAGNLQLFVDSFLRGWPSVFLPSDAQKQHYETWCQQYRQKVWEALREELFVRGMRMEPLASDNVIFNVRRSAAGKVKITPYYLANEQTLLVMLDQNYGMSYYVNPWQHRTHKVERFSSPREKRQAYLQCFKDAVEQLSQGRYPEALEGFKQSLRLYPIAAGEALLAGYWTNNFRDTAPEFQAFSELAAALFNYENNRKQSCTVFSNFIAKYPDFLPDPYLYLGFNEHKQSADFFKQKQQLVKLQEDFNEGLDGLVQLGVLVPEGDRRGGRGKFKIIGGANFDRSDIDDLNKQQSRLVNASKELKLKEQLLWEDIRQAPNEKIKQATALDQNYVATVFKVCRLEMSKNFRRLVGSLYGVLRAEAFMEIRASLEKALHEKGEKLIEGLKVRDSASQAKILEQLADLVSSHSGGVYLSAEDLKPLNDLREFLENLSTVDSIMRENIIRRQFDDAIGVCIRSAYKSYDAAVNFNMGLTQVRQQYTDCIGYTWSYLTQVKSLIGGDKFVLHNGLTNTKFVVLDTAPSNFQNIVLNGSSNTVDLVDGQGRAKPVLKYDRMDPEIIQYLTGEFAKPEFLAQIRASGLRFPYALLFTPINAHPVMQRWQKTLEDLRPWLIQALAHLGLLPLEDKVINREEVLAFSDKAEAVTEIKADLDHVWNDFIARNNLAAEEILVRKIESLRE